MGDDEQQRASGGPGPAEDEARTVGEGPAGEAGPADEAGREDQAARAHESSPAGIVEPNGGRGVALRLLAAAVTLPWLVMYGITGAWAVTVGVRGAARGLPHLDAGYTRMVTPLELMYVGGLLLAAFAVLLACALLLISGRRSAMLWLPVLLVASGLTAGSVWAAISGGLHPLLWILFFFGLAYATSVALVRVVQVTRAGRRARIVAP
jgi:hypothetical protein